jgi:sRNA-binding protein
VSGRAAKIAAANALIVRLAETWPQTFFVYQKRRRPLPLKIHIEVLSALGDITPREVSAAFRVYCGNYEYLRACREGAGRVDLDGNVVGVVSAEEAQLCASRVAAYRALRKMVAVQKPILSKVTASGPRRLSLGDLKAAAAARRQAEGMPCSSS